MQIRKGKSIYNVPKDFLTAKQILIRSGSTWYAAQKLHPYEDFPSLRLADEPIYFKERYEDNKLRLVFYPPPKKQHQVRVMYQPIVKEW